LWVSEFQLYNNVAPVVVVIATATNQVEGQFTLPGNRVPGAIAFGPHGKTAWVVAGGAAVDTIDVASWKKVSQINTLGGLVQPAVSPDGETLLLPNSGDSQVAAVGVSHGGTLANIPVGAMNWSTSQNPQFIQSGALAASPDGERIYATNQSSNNVNVIDSGSKEVITSVEAGAEPVAITVSADGSKAYVANSFDNSLSVIDTKTFHAKKIHLPSFTYPSAIAISPDSSRIYVAGNNPIPDFGGCGCRVFVLDTTSDAVVASIALDYPQALLVSPDGTKLYVVSGGTTLYTLSTTTNRVISTLTLPGFGPVGEPASSGIAITSDGSHLFVDDGGDNKIFEIDTMQNKIVHTTLAGQTAGILAITPDSDELWAGDYSSTFASVINVSNGEVIRTIPLGNQSYGIAFAPQ
jgi:YVTN family beta-propeller protein